MKEQAIAILKTTAGKIVLGGAALLGGYEAKQWYDSRPAPIPASAWTSLPRPEVTRSGRIESWEMMAARVYTTASGRVLISDMSDYKNPACRTIVVEASVLAGRAITAGKKVTAKGEIGTYAGRAQLVASEIAF